MFGFPKVGSKWKNVTVVEVDTTDAEDYRIVMSDGSRLTYMEWLKNYSN